MGQTEEIKGINKVLDFLDSLGNEGNTMAGFLDRKKRSIVEIFSLYTMSERGDIDNFLKKYDLTDYTNELKLFHKVCFFAASHYNIERSRIKLQTQKKVEELDHNPNLLEDLKALKEVDFREYEPFESFNLINSININYGNNQTYNIKSKDILTGLEGKLIEIIKDWLKTFDVENPPKPPKTKDFAKKFMLPVYKFIEAKQPGKKQKEYCKIITDFWALCDKNSRDSNYFKRYIIHG